MKLFVDNLTVIDCSYLHDEVGMQGESWIVDVVLHGALNDCAMIMDFGRVKKQIKRAIDTWVDHCLVVAKDSTQCQWQEENGQLTLHFTDMQGRRITHISPHDAVCLLPAPSVTMAGVQLYLETRLMEVVEEGVERVEVTLRTEMDDRPYYHYTHGLKKHDGNCQRIAHGHRSCIEIWRNGTLATDLMEQLAARWKHIYLVSAEDVVEEYEHGNQPMLKTAYNAPQGRFELILPRACCDIIPCDSTVESIAAYLAQSCKENEPTAHFCVKAYEGVGKGALAEARCAIFMTSDRKYATFP